MAKDYIFSSETLRKLPVVAGRRFIKDLQDDEQKRRRDHHYVIIKGRRPFQTMQRLVWMRRVRRAFVHL